MWLGTALFLLLMFFGLALQSLPANATVWFVVALICMFVGVPLLFLCALYAFSTVRCGECDERFFDFVFLWFPVQGGCQACGAPLEVARTVPLSFTRHK
jgi:hypothetical protein